MIIELVVSGLFLLVWEVLVPFYLTMMGYCGCLLTMAYIEGTKMEVSIRYAMTLILLL